MDLVIKLAGKVGIVLLDWWVKSRRDNSALQAKWWKFVKIAQKENTSTKLKLSAEEQLKRIENEDNANR